MKSSSDGPDEEMGYALTQEQEEDVPLLSAQKEAEIEQDIAENGGNDVVQFSAPMYYADESEKFLKVDILRLGSKKGKAAVKFFTTDGSAKSSKQYASMSCQLVFEEGEGTKSVNIAILEDGDWTPTAEFRVCLSSTQNCHLDSYLHAARVKILNADSFPTDSLDEHVRKGAEGVQQIPDWTLFQEYCKLNYGSSGVKWQTILVLVMDQFSNIFLFGALWIGVYIVDTIFARGGGASKRLLVADRYHTAVIVAFWFVIPHMVMYGWETIKTHMDIKGASREFLQVSLMKNYFDYTAESRHLIAPSDMTTLIDQGAEEVANGYSAALKIVGIIGKIITVEVFIVLFQPEPLAIYSVLIMAVMLVVFAAFRAKTQQHAKHRLDNAQTYVDLITDESCRKFELVRDYSKRSVMNDMFAHAVRKYSKEMIPETMVELTTQYTTKFLSGIFIAIYIVAKTPDVLNGDLSLGIFLATITVFGTYLSDAFTELNTSVSLIITAFVPLKAFTMYLNLPLDLPALKKINRARREHTRQKRASITAHQSPRGGRAADFIKIEALDLTLEYHPGFPVFKNVNIALAQGQMIAVTGPHKSGKTTFIQLLANMLVPTGGSIMFPSHLRVLHVTRQPIFLKATMLSNLCLGLPHGEIIDIDRVCSILRLCGVAEIVAIVEFEIQQKSARSSARSSNSEAEQDKLRNDEIRFTESSDMCWEKTLTHSQKVKLQMARALIANPSVMILQRSLEGLNDEAAMNLLDALQQHVIERGLFLPEDRRSHRAPSNVFFSTETPAQAAKANVILQVDPVNKTIVDISGAQ